MSFSDAAPRIINHMNEDHADALRLYVQAFSDVAPNGPVRMTAINAQSMTLHLESTDRTVHIPFDPPLTNADDAHHRLVQMVQQAQTQLSDANPAS